MCASVIAFVVPDDLPCMTTVRMVYEIVRKLQDVGYGIYFASESENPTALKRMWNEQDLAGVVTWGEEMPHVLEGIDTGNIPVMGVQDLVNTARFPVDLLLRESVMLQLHHLTSTGRRKPVFATMKNWSLPVFEKYKEQVIKEASEKFGLEVPPTLVIDSYSRGGYWTIDTSGISSRIMRLLQEYPQADSFFCADDEVAMAIISGLRQVGRMVPADISVVGCGDTEMGPVVEPSLTTVHQELEDIGTVGASAILSALGLECPLQPPTEVKQSLVVRASA